MGIKRWFDYLK